MHAITHSITIERHLTYINCTKKERQKIIIEETFLHTFANKCAKSYTFAPKLQVNRTKYSIRKKLCLITY